MDILSSLRDLYIEHLFFFIYLRFFLKGLDGSYLHFLCLFSLVFESVEMLNAFIKFFLENKMVTFLLLILVLSWGIIVSPFKWDLGFLPYDPVPVDAIPDLGENLQIVFTEWIGKSPRDM